MERTLHEKMEEHAYPYIKNNKQSLIYEHLLPPPPPPSPPLHYSDIVDLFNLNNHDVNYSNID